MEHDVAGDGRRKRSRQRRGNGGDNDGGDDRAELVTTIAELRVQLAVAQGETTARDAVIAELRDQVAWLRLPWWRRLVGTLLVVGSLTMVNATANAQRNGMSLLSQCKIAMEMRDQQLVQVFLGL
jgi:hypothetical protein